MPNQRYHAIQAITQRQARKFEVPVNERGAPKRISDYFGMNTFNPAAMKEKLSKDTQQKLLKAIQSGKPLDRDVANTIAQVIKDWALEHGATHFCHWFQPQTGLTAEKHDAFLSLDDGQRPVEKFSGAQLIQSEPDASSFPSGGMRTTFEARGYTAWDPSSPIFIMENTNGKTLCIPSVFISYHGDALDEKAPLLRSMEALNARAVELLHTMGYKDARRVVPTIGAEQEYFLIDRSLHNLRPDLMMTGRTLLGGQPPKGQQLEDHYFGSIPSRILSYMQEIEQEMFKLGVPAKTRHNEVAPSQYEMAPIFEEANIAADHNQLAMEIMRKVAARHSFSVLLHEKPFAGVNGSGKHCNWSLVVTGEAGEDANLLEPGKTPHQNLRFLMMLAAVLRAVHRHGGLLRGAVAFPGNDHRLGANEAPPAIISMFLGKQLADICDRIENGVNLEHNADATIVGLGISQIPRISKDNTDRNRTSPLAFTGNKFEFRAVGSSATISFPVTVMNATVAEAMVELNEELKKELSSGKKMDVAILDVVRATFVKTHHIRFEGNNYSDEWVIEAEKRKLPNLRKAPEAIEQLLSESATQLFTKLGVLSAAELHSRAHVMVERYVKKLTIELETLASMIDTYVVPAAQREQYAMASSLKSAMDVGRVSDMSEQTGRLTTLCHDINELLRRRKELSAFLTRLTTIESELEKARILSKEGIALMEQIRVLSDRLEDTVSDHLWPLPKYREMLFIA